MGRPSKYKDGRPGVTTIIGLLTNLENWYRKYGFKRCDQKKKITQDIGHRVHKAIEIFTSTGDINKATLVLTTKRELSMFREFAKIIQRLDLFNGMSEIVLNSEKYFFGGTLDYFIRGCIYDWKTDSAPRNKYQERERLFKYKLQTAGYAIALEEEKGIKCSTGCIIRVTKNRPPKVKIYNFKISSKFKKIFLNLREIYKAVKGK